MVNKELLNLYLENRNIIILPEHETLHVFFFFGGGISPTYSSISLRLCVLDL